MVRARKDEDTRCGCISHVPRPSQGFTSHVACIVGVWARRMVIAVSARDARSRRTLRRWCKRHSAHSARTKPSPRGSHYATGTQRVLNGYSTGTQRVLNGYSTGTQRVLNGYATGTQRVRNGYSTGTQRVLNGYSAQSARAQACSRGPHASGRLASLVGTIGRNGSDGRDEIDGSVWCDLFVRALNGVAFFVVL